MFETLRNALKVKDIRKRLLFTLVVLIICRLGSQLPIPGIDTDTISQYLNSLLGDSFNLLNSFTGGSFESMSLFALNVTPYITASIIIQLLTIAIRHWKSCIVMARTDVRRLTTSQDLLPSDFPFLKVPVWQSVLENRAFVKLWSADRNGDDCLLNSRISLCYVAWRTDYR